MSYDGNAAGTASGYSAAVGFEAITGWGSPDGAAGEAAVSARRGGV